MTGGTGYLGQALLRTLAAEGFRLRAIVRPESDISALDAIDDAHPETPIERIRCHLDAAVDAVFEALSGVDVVFHLASALSGGPEAVMRGTLATSSILLDAIQQLAVPPRVVLVGSIAVHDTAGLADGATVDARTALDPRPALRDAYTHAKIQQELMFRERCTRHGIPLAVVRPGIIHGPGRAGPSARVGFAVPAAGVFLLIGGDNPLPLVHVDNCAAALTHVAKAAAFDGEAFNVIDEPLPGCRAYLERYRAAHRPAMRIVAVPSTIGRLAARLSPMLHAHSRGRLPLLLSPYRWRSSWRPFRYDSAGLRSVGFVPPLAGEAALASTLEAPARGA